MTNRLVLVAAIIGAVLISAVALSPLLVAQNVSADKNIFNKCVIEKQTGKCEFDQKFKSKRGDINVKNEIDASAIANGGGGSSGNVSTVDQQARDRITALENENVGLKNRIDSQDGQLLAFNASNASAFKEIKILQDRESLVATTLNTLVENNATVFGLLNSSITDVEGGSNQSTGPIPPVDNGSGPVIPPVDNGTAGNVTNDNGTGPVIPPINNTGGVIVDNSTGTNSTAVTNTTSDVTNSTNSTNNSTGNITG